MSDIDPITIYHFEPDKFEVRAELVYPDSVLNEMARRVGDKLDKEILARLGYVKVVRCKDCKRAFVGAARTDLGEPVLCHRTGWHVRPDGYCAWGVRRKVAE